MQQRWLKRQPKLRLTKRDKKDALREKKSNLKKIQLPKRNVRKKNERLRPKPRLRSRRTRNLRTIRKKRRMERKTRRARLTRMARRTRTARRPERRSASLKSAKRRISRRKWRLSAQRSTKPTTLLHS